MSMNKLSFGEKIFNVINILFMILLCAGMIYPVIFVIGRSMMDEAYMARHPFAVFPVVSDFSGYEFIFSKDAYVLNSFFVTVLRTLIGTLFNLFFTILMAYTIFKKKYPLRIPLTLLVVLTMWFSGGLVPYFLLIRSLGLVDTFWVYIFPGLISAWNLILLRNFFLAIPAEIEESAVIDGANDLRILFQMFVPISQAVLATLILFYAVGHWNAWFDAVMFVNKKDIWTIQAVLRQILQSASLSALTGPGAVISDTPPPASTVKFATIVVATVPILSVYPFLQKYFVKGVLVGSLKG